MAINMRQIRTYSDQRLDYVCTFCGALPDTKDHVPSRIFLDDPFPENLPVIPCCSKCNQGFSLDEEYIACLIECAIHGTTSVKDLHREKVKKILSKKELLRGRITSAIVEQDGNKLFIIEEDRVKNVA